MNIEDLIREIKEEIKSKIESGKYVDVLEVVFRILNKHNITYEIVSGLGVTGFRFRLKGRTYVFLATPSGIGVFEVVELSLKSWGGNSHER